MGSRPYTQFTLVHPTAAVVEIGAERGEGSTAFLSNLAAEAGVPFYSVDINPAAPEGTIIRDGAQWLADFDEDIQLAYLDNFDYQFPEAGPSPLYETQKRQYRNEFGVEMTNEASEVAHLVQAQFVADRAVSGAVIIFDDTYYNAAGELTGKGCRGTRWLQEQGWVLVNEPTDDFTTGYAMLKGPK